MTSAQRPRKSRSLQGRSGVCRGGKAAQDRGHPRPRGVGGLAPSVLAGLTRPGNCRGSATWEETVKGPFWALFSKHSSNAVRFFLT